MAFPVTAVLDTFTGTDDTALPTYSANWKDTSEADLEIKGNSATGTIGGNCSNYWDTAYGPDSEVYATMATKSPNGEALVLALRVTTPAGPRNSYDLVIAPQAATDLFWIQREDAGVATELGARMNQEFASGEKVGLEMIGTTLQAYRHAAGAWAAMGTTRTDSTYSAAGNLLLYVSDVTVRLDDFGGGTIASSASPAQYLPPIYQVGAGGFIGRTSV